MTFTLDSTAPGVPTITSPVTGSSTRDTTPTFTGTGEAGATIAVDISGAETTALINGSGSWTLDFIVPLSVATYQATAYQTDPAGNSGTTSAITFSIVGSPTVTSITGGVVTYT